ncbi:prenyltransferase/squalene oxidase repeat-containing protein [Flindersiella endophytica]
MVDDPAVEWLLTSDEPAVRYVTRRDLLAECAEADAGRILDGPKVSALLAGQRPDGGYGTFVTQVGRYRGASRSPDNLIRVETVPGNPDRGWTAPMWRLIALTELAVPADDPRVRAAANYVLELVLRDRRHHGRPLVKNGLVRACAGGEGAALRIACRLGMAEDPRARRLAEALLEWQWPDGGWNCHRNASGRRSTFNHSLNAAWGLHEYAQATGDTRAADAADRTAELFLEHRLLFSLGTGIPSRFRPNPPPKGRLINKRWAQLGYPAYWHYDILAVLTFLTRFGRIDDPRASDGLDLLESKRRKDGLWAADRQWWAPTKDRCSDVVEWGRAHQPSELITLNALRILRAAGRLPATT